MMLADTSDLLRWYLLMDRNTEVFVFAGERPRHAGSDGVAPRGAGGPPSDLQAVARIRSGRLAGVAAGLHCCSNGK